MILDLAIIIIALFTFASITALSVTKVTPNKGSQLLLVSDSPAAQKPASPSPPPASPVASPAASPSLTKQETTPPASP